MGFIKQTEYYVIKDVLLLYDDPLLKTLQTRVKAGSPQVFTAIDVKKNVVTFKYGKGTCYVSPVYAFCFQLAITLIPALNLPAEVENRGREEQRKVKPLDLNKKGMVRRSDFVSIPRPKDRPSDYKPDSQMTGAVRPPEITKRVNAGDIVDFEFLSTHTGQKMELSGTYCHSLHWSRTIRSTATTLLRPRESVSGSRRWRSSSIRTRPPTSRGIKKSLAAQNRSFGESFFKTKEGKWKGSAQGMLQLFNNIDNLVLSCKNCNQMLKSGTTGRQMLSRSATFGKEFKNFARMGLEGTLGTPSGEALGRQVDAYNQLDRNRSAIDLHREVFRTSMKRENRVNEALLFNAKGDPRAEGKERKKRQ